MENEDKLTEILGEFDAGIFNCKAMETLKMVALGTVETGKKGKVIITLDFDRIGDSNSVQIHHSLTYTKPTKNGKISELNTTSTPMYVDTMGYLTISPKAQADLFQSEKPNNTFKINGVK